MSRAWGRGSTRAWRKVRARVLERDGFACQLNIPNVCTLSATHVHHMMGKVMGDDPSQLVASCAPCNLHLGEVSTIDPVPTPRTRW